MVQPRYFVSVVEFHPETTVKFLSGAGSEIFFLETCGPSLSVDTSYHSPVVTWHELLSSLFIKSNRPVSFLS